jgi:hypothetical protein
VLRANYYPQGNLIDTVFTRNPSPTWSAIVHGLNLLKEGLIWHIGDGKIVCIWRDNWLPRKEELKVLREKGRSRLIRVSSLIDQGRWDEGLLHRTFPPIDAEAISWPGKMKVMDYFLVQSAYRVGLRLSQQRGTFATSSAAPLGDKPIWKVIWKCKIPLKVRIFAWKALVEGLAMEVNKRRRHIPVFRCLQGMWAWRGGYDACNNGVSSCSGTVVGYERSMGDSSMERWWSSRLDGTMALADVGKNL